MKKNWKTTALGVCALLTAIGLAGTALLDNDPTTTSDINSIIAALFGLGLISAKDGDK